MRHVSLLVVFVVTAGAGNAFAEAPVAPLPMFDPASAVPYFARGAAAEARSRFAVEDHAQAARLFDAYLAAHPGAADGPQAAFLAALAHARAGHASEAAARFEKLVAGYPLLADHHAYHAARAWLAARDAGKAQRAARAVAADSPLAAEAMLLTADALRMTDAASEAARLYLSYLERYPDSWRGAEARFRLAQSLEAVAAASRPAPGPAPRAATPRPPAAVEPDPAAAARDHYRRVFIHSPTSGWAEESRARLAALGEPPALNASERLARGLALFEEMRNESSEAELAAAMAAPGLSPAQRCVAAWHRAQSVFKQRNRPRAAPLFDEAVTLCEQAPRDDVTVAETHAKGLYQAGRCHSARGEATPAIRLFLRIAAEHGAHSYADDARLRIAEVLDDVRARLAAPRPAAAAAPAAAVSAGPAALAAVESAVAGGATALDQLDPSLLGAARDHVLATVAEKYPQGDMGGEALFRVALRAFTEQRLEDARTVLEKELTLFPREEGWTEAGRTLYWLARVAAAQHRETAAATLYARAVREYPLSYYALIALGRLRSAAPDQARELVDELRRPSPSPEDLAWRFPPDALYGSAGFRRGVELARLGLGAEARRELAAVGLRAEKRGARVADPARAAQLWLVAVLYDRAGEWALSHAIPRHAVVDYARSWPSGDNWKRWAISYPRGYEALVLDHAGRNGQPAALQFAIIREESAFDPLDESFANAIGLTQLTQAPARRFAGGLPYTREALRDPVINITIGARELGDLWKRTAGYAPFAIAGYNAGDTVVHRWRAARPSIQLDEWIERIPFDETRGYAKRVLSSYFVYQWLYETGDAVPALSQAMPPP